MTKLSDRLEVLAEKAKLPSLSLPGEPAYSIEMERKFNANNGLRELMVNNLPEIIAALKERGQ